jgi:anaerobic selenocysteine-containing dehydrogenase
MATNTEDTKRHFRTCTLCEAMCGLIIETGAGTAGPEIRSIKPDPDDVLSKGHICPKAVALQDIQTDPDRLRQPVRRTATGWEQIGWDEAFDEVARRISEVQAKYGKNAVALYQGNPTVHNYGSMMFAQLYFGSLRTKNRFSATSVDQLPHQFAAYFMFGHQLMVPIPDIDRTSYMLILGANPAASNGSLMSAPGTTDRMKAIRARGGKVILVDPRRTESAAVVDEHHFIRPQTDVLLLMAILQTIFAEGLDRSGRLEKSTKGLPDVRKAVADMTPERVAAKIGIAADDIRRIAREFAQSPTAVCYGRFGVSTQPYGAVAHWLINVLNLVTGNIDREGGAMFTLPAIDVVGLTRKAPGGLRGGYNRWRSRVRGLPEFAGELPVATLAEEMLTEGDGQVRAFITSAGNPVLSTPNGAQLERALEKLDFMFSIDFYINETTRHAHIILPPTPPLEHEHYDVIFHALAVRNTTKFSPAVLEAPKTSRHDWAIFLELQRRLGKGGIGKRTSYELMRRLGPNPILALGLRAGPYGKKLNPLSSGLTLKKVKSNLHGIDLGGLKPMLPARLANKDGLIDAAPAVLLNDVARVRRELLEDVQENGAYDLLLIGRRHVRSNNSWMHNYTRLVKGPNRCTLLIHPDDAAARGLTNGQCVRLATRIGEVEAPVEVSDTMMPGVVSLPHGWGHNRPGTQAGVAQAHAGVSLNDITDDKAIDTLAGTAVLNGIPVRIHRP